MNAVDTNVLIYAHDPRDPQKQAAAGALIQSMIDGASLWQVACEYLSASRKLQFTGYSAVDAWHDVQDLHLVWTTLYPNWTVLARSRHLMQNYSLSFWDGLIIAACLEGGVDQLYTENFSSYPAIESLTIINPFMVTP